MELSAAAARLKELLAAGCWLLAALKFIFFNAI